MSDDPWLPVIDQADIEAALQRKKSRDSRLVEQEAEIARLRAELATARLQPTLNPDRWRGAINDALIKIGWLDPIREDEAPKDALDRLINFEIQVSLDQKTSERIEDMILAARREGMEQAAQIADGRPSDRSEDIAAAIRAAAKEGKP